MGIESGVFYELCRRRHPAARQWIIGEILISVGRLSAGVGVSGLLYLGIGFGIMGRGWTPPFVFALTALIGWPVVLLGRHLYSSAWEWAKRDGVAPKSWPARIP
jgi:hypothetical protein